MKKRQYQTKFGQTKYGRTETRLSEGGLTLVEIMVVLVILGILYAMLGQRVFGAGDKAKRMATELQLISLKQDIEQFRLRYNQLPTTLDDLSKCTDVTGPGCLPIVGEDSLVDAWDNPFSYSTKGGGRSYRIESLGADQKAGGEGADFDIYEEGP